MPLRNGDVGHTIVKVVVFFSRGEGGLKKKIKIQLCWKIQWFPREKQSFVFIFQLKTSGFFNKTGFWWFFLTSSPPLHPLRKKFNTQFVGKTIRFSSKKIIIWLTIHSETSGFFNKIGCWWFFFLASSLHPTGEKWTTFTTFMRCATAPIVKTINNNNTQTPKKKHKNNTHPKKDNNNNNTHTHLTPSSTSSSGCASWCFSASSSS